MLPQVALAEDLVSQDILNDEQVTETLNNPPAPVSSEAGLRSNDPSGIFVHDGKAFIVQQLQAELGMPDGSKVHPDGKILGADGSEKLMSSGQMLTLDGQVKVAPFSGTADATFSTGLSPIQGALKPESNFPGVSDSPSSATDVLNFDQNGDFSD